MATSTIHRIKASLAGVILAGSLGLAASAHADTAILDQIGTSAANIGTNISGSQYFEAANAAYNIAAGDDFTAPASLLKITTVQAVVGGYNGYTTYTSITGWQVDIYSSIAAAGANLVGNVFSVNLTPAQVTANTAFSSASEALITLPVNFTLPAAGTYYVTVIPTNAFTPNGQTGIYNSLSTTGGTNAFQANPNGGFGFGATQTTSPATDLAYRVNAVPEPSAYALMGVGTVALGATIRLRRGAR